MEKWTESDIDFLRENYIKLGNKELSFVIKKSINSIRYKLKKLNLIRSNKYKSILFSLEDKIDLYIMGFLWADGYLHDTKNRLELCILKDDFDDISNLFDENIWSIRHRTRINRRIQTTIGLYKKDICSLFRNNYNYDMKSLESPNFINEIPENLLYFFIRGIFDGDGCFYVSKDGIQKQCYLAGTYDQDWSWIENIFDKFNIKYITKRKIQKKTEKYSVIYIKRKSIKLLGDFIYKNYNIDNIGLTRKYNKYLKCI